MKNKLVTCTLTFLLLACTNTADDVDKGQVEDTSTIGSDNPNPAPDTNIVTSSHADSLNSQ
jgi:hypothetical protein